MIPPSFIIVRSWSWYLITSSIAFCVFAHFSGPIFASSSSCAACASSCESGFSMPERSVKIRRSTPARSRFLGSGADLRISPSSSSFWLIASVSPAWSRILMYGLSSAGSAAPVIFSYSLASFPTAEYLSISCTSAFLRVTFTCSLMVGSRSLPDTILVSSFSSAVVGSFCFLPPIIVFTSGG